VLHHVGNLADRLEALRAPLVVLELRPGLLVLLVVDVEERVPDLHPHAVVVEPRVLTQRSTADELPPADGAPLPLRPVLVLLPLVKLWDGSLFVQVLDLFALAAASSTAAYIHSVRLEHVWVGVTPGVLLVWMSSSHVHDYALLVVIQLLAALLARCKFQLEVV